MAIILMVNTLQHVHMKQFQKNCRLKNKWLEKDFKAHKALKEVVLDKHLRKDIR